MSSNQVTEGKKQFFESHGVNSSQIPMSSQLAQHDSVYSLYDVCTGLYEAPFLSINDATAIRVLSDVIVRRDSTLQLHPEDFKLFCLGKFDKVLGVLMPETCRQVCNLKDLFNRPTLQKGFSEDGEVIVPS